MATALVSSKQDRAKPEAPSSALVRVQKLSKSFGKRGSEVHVLKDIDIEVARGELLVLLGPSGCGKTTLLRSLVGLERPDRGRIELGGSCVFDAARGSFVPPNRRDVAMVFQNYALWPHMTVRKNVAYPLRSRRLKDALAAGRVDEVLDIVQCGHLADRYPTELSGGQQQRVSLARALAPSPALLLLDEPLSNLDALLRVELRAQLRALHRELGFTAVHVTHDQEEAIALGTRVAVLNAGRVEQVGDPTEVYRAPATEYVADFLGARNKLELTASSAGARIANQVLRRSLSQSLDGEFVLRVRDEHLRIRSGASPSGPSEDVLWLEGARVVEVLPAIDATECVLELDGRRFYARVPDGAVDARPGDAVDVGILAERAACYGPDGVLIPDWTTPAPRSKDR